MTTTIDFGMFQPVDACELYEVNGGGKVADMLWFAAGSGIAGGGVLVVAAGIGALNPGVVGAGLAAVAAGVDIMRSSW